jgi:hypothetical protein
MEDNGKLTPDSLGLKIVDSLCTELGAEGADFLSDNEWLNESPDLQKGLAEYRHFPIEAVRYFVEQKKIGVTREGEWCLPIEGFFKTPDSMQHRVFGRQIKGAFGKWRYSPPGTPLPIVPFYLGNYVTAENIIICEGAWDAMSLAIGAGWHLPGHFPLNTSILGVRGVNTVRDLFGFIGKIWEGQRRIVVIAQNDEAGLKWINEPTLFRGLIENASGIWLTCIKPSAGKDINDALNQDDFKGWSLDTFLEDIGKGLYRPKEINYGPIKFYRHQPRQKPALIPNGERNYGLNGAKDNFPLDVFPQLVQDLVQERAKIHKLEIPQSCLTVLSCTSACVGPLLTAKGFAPGRTTYANLFALLTAPPGAGKSTLLQFFEPLREKEAELLKDFRTEVYPKLMARLERLEKEKNSLNKAKDGRASAQAAKPIRSMEDVCKEIHQTQEQINTPPTLAVGKTTIPCLVKTIQGLDKYIFQIMDESSAHICQVMGLSKKKDDSPDLDCYLSLFSHSPYSNDTLTRGRITAEGWLGLLWCMQPVVKETLQGSKDFTGRGFFARCLFVDTRTTEIPLCNDLDQPCPTLWESYKAGINKLLAARLSKVHTELVCTDHGRERLNEIHNEESQFRNSVLRQYRDCFGRQREIAIKLYMLLYALETAFTDTPVETEFSIERLDKAFRLSKWFHEEMAGMVLKDGMIGHRRLLQKVTDLLKSYQHCMLSQGDLKDLGISFDRFQTLWSIFPDSFVVWKSLTVQGRPTTFIGTAG